MSDPWNHAVCIVCCNKDRREQVARDFGKGPWEACCRCGEWTTAGIYFRSNPSELPCKGKHAEIFADEKGEPTP